jgi:hypothetical protein
MAGFAEGGIGGTVPCASGGIGGGGGVGVDWRRAASIGIGTETTDRTDARMNRLETNHSLGENASVSVGVLASPAGEPVNASVFPRRPGSERQGGPSWTTGRGMGAGALQALFFSSMMSAAS